jgi:hypothetical protein
VTLKPARYVDWGYDRVIMHYIVTEESAERRSLMRDWCYQTFKPYTWHGDRDGIMFKKERDAMLCALRWAI